MRILFLTPSLPFPPSKGTAARNLHLIKGAAQSHQVHLLSFADSISEGAQDALGDYCQSVVTVPVPQRGTLDRLTSLFASRLPDLAFRLSSPLFRQRLREELAKRSYDLVQVEGLEMAPYGLMALSLVEAAAKPPLVLYDAHNAEHTLQYSALRADMASPTRWPQAVYSLIQWQRLRRYEREVCCRCQAVLAVSDKDAAALRLLVPGLRARVVPNGVDTAYFGYRPPPKQGKRREPCLIFTGTMDYRPNVDAVVWFCRRILPTIRRQVPQAHLLVVGRDPAPAIRRLASPSVTITGRVGDIRPYLSQGAVFVAPLRMGSGTRLKVLEAMASGLPVVSTSMGIEGIAATPGEEALVADTPPEFAAAVVELLTNLPLAQKLASRARLLVEGRYDWQAILPKLEEAYRHLSQSKHDVL
jgi:sugar transferase (PEP-CTERM/EpsH1 system associated)